MEASVFQALAEAQARSAVEDCIREMISDVELARQLEEQLASAYEIGQLKKALVERDWEVEETRALETKRKAVQSELADGLVRELWCLSHKIGELEDIKQQHQELLVRYDEAVAKLMQAEEDLEQARNGSGLAENKEPEQEDGSDEAEPLVVSPTEDSAETFASGRGTPDAPPPTNESVSVPAPATIAEMVVDSEQQNERTTAAAPATGREGKVDGQADPDIPSELLSQPDQQQQQKPTTAVVSLEQDSAPETPTLAEFDTKILMLIFGYLDALDILNTAQVNISMYSRVDSLFGLGNTGVGGSTDGDNSTIATVETAPSTQPTTATATSASQSTATRVTTAPSVAAAPPTATAPSRPVVAKPVTARTVSPPVIQHTRSGSQEGIRGIFNMLQGKPSSRHSPPRRGASAPAADTPAPMNAAMANSMAAKLSDAELNAIILMTERLRQKEAQAEELVRERDKLAAQLDGTESVKQFLVQKVRDMEMTMSAVEENETKVAQQIASDQEVIAFLDGRIQELERRAVVLKEEVKKSQDELARVREQADQKGMVMGDMLQFEREKSSESEREWKATRKVLIKEVKSCRAQIVALQAERDGYREQNDALRRAVLSSPNKSALARDRTNTSF